MPALPTTEQVRQTMRRDDQADQTFQAEPFPVLAAAFEHVPGATLRRRLAALTGSTEAGLADSLTGFEEELTFHVLTTPDLRAALAADDSDAGDTAAVGARPELDRAGLSPGLRAALR